MLSSSIKTDVGDDVGVDASSVTTRKNGSLADVTEASNHSATISRYASETRSPLSRISKRRVSFIYSRWRFLRFEFSATTIQSKQKSIVFYKNENRVQHVSETLKNLIKIKVF